MHTKFKHEKYLANVERDWRWSVSKDVIFSFHKITWTKDNPFRYDRAKQRLPLSQTHIRSDELVSEFLCELFTIVENMVKILGSIDKTYAGLLFSKIFIIKDSPGKTWIVIILWKKTKVLIYKFPKTG